MPSRFSSFARRALLAVFLCLVGAVVPARAQLVIQFDYSQDSGGFFTGTNSARQAYLDAAADYVSGFLNAQQLSAVTSTGSNHLTTIFTNPGTGSTVTLSDQSVAANTLLVYAGGRDLGGSTLGQGGSGGFGWSGSFAFGRQATGRSTATGTDLPALPWGGSISFDAAGTSWYFDSDIGTVDVPGGQYDFFSVATHELFHLMGFGNTSAPPSDVSTTTYTNWSSFITGSTFTGPGSMAEEGGAVALSPEKAHWFEGTMSTAEGSGDPQEAMMDPTIGTGIRKYVTALDLAGLADLGWQVSGLSTIPEPATWSLVLGLCFLGLAVWRRRAAAPGPQA
jgi:hypothetical protein